jgi:hypothetical protein
MEIKKCTQWRTAEREKHKNKQQTLAAGEKSEAAEKI